MDLLTLLNFFKWQLKNRSPGGGFYDRAFLKKEGVDIDTIEHYLYLCVLYKKPLKIYVFGSY